MRRVLLPFLPDDPRRRRRRAYTTGGLSPISRSLMPQRIEERVRPITPQLAWRVAVLGGIAFVLFAIVFFRLWYLQVLTGDQARLQGARQPLPQGARSRRRAGTSWTATTTKLVRTKRAAVVQIVPSLLPESVREQADEYRKALAAAEQERAARRRPPARVRAPAARRRPQVDTARTSASELRRLRRPPRGPGRRRSRPRPRTRPELLRALPAHRRGHPRPADDDPRARDPRHRRRAVLERHDPHRRPARAVQLHARAARVLPRRRGHQALPAPLPARRARARSCSGRSPRSPTSSSTMDELRGDRAGHADRPERARGALRQVPARRRRLLARRRRRVRAAATSSAGSRSPTPSRASG